MLSSGLSPWHLMLVLAVAVLLFGSKKLPDMARGLGQSMRILKAESKALKEDGKSTHTTTAASPAVESGQTTPPSTAPAPGQRQGETGQPASS